MPVRRTGGSRYDEANGLSEAATAEAIASWGANVVRLPLNQDCWSSTNRGAAVSDHFETRTATTYRTPVKDFAAAAQRRRPRRAARPAQPRTAPGDPDSGAEMLRDARRRSTVQFWESVATNLRRQPGCHVRRLQRALRHLQRHDRRLAVFELSWECWRDGSCDVPVEEADAASFSGDTYPAVGMTQLVETIRGQARSSRSCSAG